MAGILYHHVHDIGIYHGLYRSSDHNCAGELVLMKRPYLYRVPTFTDERGSLSVADALDVPFAVKRLFWVYDSDKNRGGHAHKECEQMLFCVSGSIKVTMIEGGHSDHVRLDDPALALYIPTGVFVDYQMQKGAVLLVLCSHPHDPEDYVYSEAHERRKEDASALCGLEADARVGV